MNPLKHKFLLDPEVTFLNHGSFGATPEPVFNNYQRWQRELERQPVDFITKRLPGLLTQAREQLADYLNASAEDLFFVPNATFGVNIVARSLSFGPDDEVLTTDHEYGACLNAFRFKAESDQFKIVEQPIQLPYRSADELVESFWEGVTDRTRLIFMSHITSATAGRLPVEMICRRARAAGILTLIDGAHGPGQIPLDLKSIGADFYTGNCHKWLCSPKGAAFLHAQPAAQALIQPLVVGWGYRDLPMPDFGSPFLNSGSYLGTNDLAAYLSVSAAIRFQAENSWAVVRSTAHSLLLDGLRRIEKMTGMPTVYPDGNAICPQMGIAELPSRIDRDQLKTSLIDSYQVEIPITWWRERKFIRISVQGYNDQSDIDRLISVLPSLLR